MQIPKSLSVWFKIHFVVDYIIGLPLLFAPKFTLSLFSIQAEPIAARLVGATLLGIGGISLIHKKTEDSYRTLLQLKLIWSSAAVLGLILSIFIDNAQKIIWLFVSIFGFFFFLWLYYYRKLKS